MIILDNSQSSQTIRLRLGDKFNPNGATLSLVLYRIEEGNKAYSFTITPTITGSVYTFTINPSSLPSSDYKAAVLEGLPDVVFPNCEILTPITIASDSDSPCDPALLEAELTFDALLLLGDVADTVIWQTRARVEGTTNFTTTAPTNIEPTYTVYEG
jgi:hypothetical protein